MIQKIISKWHNVFLFFVFFTTASLVLRLFTLTLCSIKNWNSSLVGEKFGSRA